MKKSVTFGTIIASLALIFFLAGDAFDKQAEEANNPLSSIESYIHYLENYDEAEALARGVDPEYAEEAARKARESAESVKTLSKKDQEDLLYYAKNPEEFFKAAELENDPRVKVSN